jgi:exodeoxyribonuclease VII large subunit
VDFTISDFCADVRAATPTAAAELIFPDLLDLQQHLTAAKAKMTAALSGLLDDYQQRINQNRRLLGDMNLLFTNVSLRLDHCTNSLLTSMTRSLHEKEQRLTELTVKLQNLSPMVKVTLQDQRLQFAKEKLIYLCKQSLDNKSRSLARQAELLDAVSPLATLARGYAIAEQLPRKTGKTTLLHDASQVQQGDKVSIRLHKGNLTCKVLDNK